jgi:hypothetical protein
MNRLLSTSNRATGTSLRMIPAGVRASDCVHHGGVSASCGCGGGCRSRSEEVSTLLTACRGSDDAPCGSGNESTGRKEENRGLGTKNGFRKIENRGWEADNRFRKAGNRGFGFPGPDAPIDACVHRTPTCGTAFAACGVQQSACMREACECSTGASVCCTSFCVCCTQSFACGSRPVGDCATSSPRGKTPRVCGTAFALCGSTFPLFCTRPSLCGCRSFPCIRQTGNRSSRTADCGLFPRACDIESCVRATARLDGAIARGVASTGPAFSTTTLDRSGHVPASLTRRRAFSSGLSHAKCPKPGFRSNVFG